MKKLTAIKIQSLTDLITNSSSELFQLRTDKTIEEVEEILSTITSGYLKPIVFNLKEYRKNKAKFEEINNNLIPDTQAPHSDWEEYWDKLEILKKEYPEYYIFDILNEWFYDPKDPIEIKNIYKIYLTGSYMGYYNDPIQADFRNFILKHHYVKDPNLPHLTVPSNILEIAYDKYMASHEMPNIEDINTYLDNIEDLDGSILLLSEEENSIPYETWDEINNMFNGINYHLG